MYKLRSAWTRRKGAATCAALLFVASVSLTGCVVDGTPAVTRLGAVAVPGLAGMWVSQAGTPSESYAFIKSTGPNDYVVSTRSKGEADPSKIYRKVFLIPLDEEGGSYAASLPLEPDNANARARLLFVLKLRTASFELRFPKDEHLLALARRAGFSVDRRSLAPSTTRDQALKLMTYIGAGDFDNGYVYRRQGWFMDAPDPHISLEQAEALKSAGKPKEALEVLLYMANRGSAEANIRVAKLLSVGPGTSKDPTLVAWYLLAAQRSGNPEAAALLGAHLQRHRLASGRLFKTPSYWFAMAEHQAGTSNVATQSSLQDAAKLECATVMASPESKWKSLADCADGFVQMARSQAGIDLMLESTSEEIAEAVVARQALKEQLRATQREIKDVAGEIKQQEEKLR